MKTALFALCLLNQLLVAAEPTLLFSDDFARDEKTPGKEDIGNGWTTNSPWRAKGHQQVDLKDGIMHVTKHAEADHGVAIFHNAAFQDGIVELRFNLSAGDDLGVDFVDRELKSVHAGHLCLARVTNKALTIMDSKTGGMDNKIRERRQAGDKSPELAALLKTKTKTFKLDLKPGDWHTLHITITASTMAVKIDGQDIGTFTSEGIAHPTKRMITLAVNKSTQVDDVKVWKTR
ncbi:MAG: DUF1080 domain-containing protein [Verrucomicrobiaceae bacterium]|nr:DUF1080 domain-containing protein [Verrucomicrobiaceae bacterium]